MKENNLVKRSEKNYMLLIPIGGSLIILWIFVFIGKLKKQAYWNLDSKMTYLLFFIISAGILFCGIMDYIDYKKNRKQNQNDEEDIQGN